jgi:Hypervirulence associated proteins TUDOR domain
MTDLRIGTRVSWKSHGGTAVGTVKRKITSDTTLARRTVRASPDDPQYLVESDNGGEAVHRPSALQREGAAE